MERPSISVWGSEYISLFHARSSNRWGEPLLGCYEYILEFGPNRPMVADSSGKPPTLLNWDLEPKRRSTSNGFRVMWRWTRESVEEEVGGSNYRIGTGRISRAPSEISIPGNSSSEMPCIVWRIKIAFLDFIFTLVITIFFLSDYPGVCFAHKPSELQKRKMPTIDVFGTGVSLQAAIWTNCSMAFLLFGN